MATDFHTLGRALERAQKAADISETLRLVQPHCDLQRAQQQDHYCSPEWRLQFAVQLTYVGRTSEALQHVELVIRMDGAADPVKKYEARQKLVELLLVEGRAKDAREVTIKLLESPGVQDNHAWMGKLLSRLLAADEALYGKPSDKFALHASKVLPPPSRIVNDYAGWGARPALSSHRHAVANITHIPTRSEMDLFVAARQPVRIAPPTRLAAFGLRHITPRLLATRAGEEPVIVEAARPAARPKETAERPLFGFMAPHTRRIQCTFGALLADVFEEGPTALPRWAAAADGESCKKLLLDSGPGSSSSSASSDKWRLYLNLFDELGEVQGAEPYHRPAHKFRDELPIPAFIHHPSSTMRKVSLWVGHGGYCSALHTDPTENLYIVISGSKRFRIYPPSEVANGRFHPPISRITPSGRVQYQTGAPGDTEHRDLFSAGYSLLRTTEPESTPFPKEAAALRARGFVVDLEAGEALYLPARWLHEVESTSTEGGGHVSVNYWWDTPEDNDEATVRWSRSEASERDEL